MGLRERVDTYFGTRVRQQRERHGWSQEELAKKLTDKGIPTYASTIAKIESDKKPRAARLGEAVAIADLFDVSVDSLLGRHTGLGSDLAFALRCLRDIASRSAADVVATFNVLNTIYLDVAAFEFEGETEIGGEVVRAATGLADAFNALLKVAAFKRPSGTPARRHEPSPGPSMAEKLIEMLGEEGRQSET